MGAIDTLVGTKPGTKGTKKGAIDTLITAPKPVPAVAPVFPVPAGLTKQATGQPSQTIISPTPTPLPTPPSVATPTVGEGSTPIPWSPANSPLRPSQGGGPQLVPPMQAPKTAQQSSQVADAPAFGLVDPAAQGRAIFDSAKVTPKENTKKARTIAAFQTVLNLPASVIANFIVKPAADVAASGAEIYLSKSGKDPTGAGLKTPNIPLLGGAPGISAQGAQATYSDAIQSGQDAKNAFVDTFFQLTGNLAVAVPMAHAIAKLSFVHFSPEALLKSIEVSRDTIKDITAGRPVDPEILQAFKELSPEQKSAAAKGLLESMPKPEPSILGKVFGITDEQAKQLFDIVTKPKEPATSVASAEKPLELKAGPSEAIDKLVQEPAKEVRTAETVQKELTAKTEALSEASARGDTETAVKIGNEMGTLRSERNALSKKTEAPAADTQGTTLYHATDQHFDNFNPSLNADDVGTWFAKNKADVTDPEVAKTRPIVKERVMKPGTKLITEEQLSEFEQLPNTLDSNKPIHEKLMDAGYRGIEYANDTVQLFEPNVDTIEAKPAKAPSRPSQVAKTGTPEQTDLAKGEEIKKVSSNLLKNNPGISQRDAEAMARDVIGGRKFSKAAQASAPDYSVEGRQAEEFNAEQEARLQGPGYRDSVRKEYADIKARQKEGVTFREHKDMYPTNKAREAKARETNQKAQEFTDAEIRAKKKPAAESAPVKKSETTLEPSRARTPEEVKAEAVKVYGNKNQRGSQHPQGLKPFAKEAKYDRPKIGKSELKVLLDNSPEFKKNPTLTLNKEGNFEFVGKTIKFQIEPEGLGVSTKNLKTGDTITVDRASLNSKGAPQQTRIYKGNEPLGFNPKNLEDLDGHAAVTETDKLTKRSDIAKVLSDKLGLDIRRGKFRAGGAIGIFKKTSEIIRLKKGGLPTLFHETGHYLDNKFDFSKDLNTVERKALMVEYGYTYEGQAIKQQKEGFAEFLRFRMTGQAERATALAPEFSKTFDARLEQLPEIKDVIDTATADYQRWKEQPAVAKVLSHISMGEEETSSLADRVTSKLHNFYTMALDDLHPLAEFSKVARKTGKVPAIRDPYILARNLRGWIGKADTFLNRGTFGKNYWEIKDGKTVAKFTGKSFTEIVGPIEKKGDINDFRAYIVAKRIVDDLAGRKIVTGISTADATAAVEALEKSHPEFKKAAEDLYAYQDQLLTYGAENGLIGPESLAKIKEFNKARVPFYRVMETTQGGYMGGKKITGNMGSQIKKIRGSEREIIDPLESIIKDTYAIINAAERNNIGVALANLAGNSPELARLFEQVDAPMAPTTVSVNEVLEKAGINLNQVPLEAIPEGAAEAMVTMFRPIQDRGPNMLNVNIGDKHLVFQVDPDLFKALQGLNAEDVGMIMKVLSMPAKILRAGATLSPDFAIRNPLRDQFSAMVYSKFGYKPGYDLVRGVFELFKKGDTYNLWKMGGGEHSMMVSLDREYLQKTFKEVLRSKGATAIHYLKHPIEALRAVSEIGEQATRLGEMRNALAAGVDPVEAAFASREITLDFARIGAKTKAVNSIIAFWNANIQGFDKMIREFKNNPGRTSVKLVAGITVPSILLYFANRKDPRWKEIPQYQKDLFWIVMTPNHIYRIPKPFELGILFGSVPERILEFMDTGDKNLFSELESAVANGATPGYIPTALVPVIENITNYSFFLQRPIVSRGQESYPAEAQAGAFTSQVAKIIGGALGYSPSKVDNLIQGYSGGLGKYATQVIDSVMDKTGITNEPSKPKQSLEGMPVIKAFMIQNPVGSSSESVNRVYTMNDTVSGELSYVRNLVKTGQTAKASAYVKEHPDIAYAKILSGVVSTFGDITKSRDQIRNSDLSPEDKKEKIDKLNALQSELAEKVLAQTK